MPHESRSPTAAAFRHRRGRGRGGGYKVGHTEINRLRDKAKGALGARYGLRAFDDLLVRTGSAPPPVLGGEVDRYIKAGGVVNL